MNLRGLGQSLNGLGDYARGSAACQKAVSIAVELGEDSFRQYVLHDLAHSCIKAGRYHEAIELSLRRFELCRQVGDLRGEALSMAVLGDAYHGLGRFEDAVSAFEQALPVFRDHFIRRFQAVCLFKLGCAHAAMGNPMQANRSLRESLPIFRELRLPAYEESVREALRALRPTLTG